MEITCGLISSNPSLATGMKEILCDFKNINYRWSAQTYDDALDQILKHTPSIVFLDMDSEWESGTTFLLYHELNVFLDKLPSFIAISETKKYSYDVIKSGMNDYLLHPFTEFDLRKCFMKFSRTCRRVESEKICIRSNTDYRFIEMRDIMYLKADNNTTDFFLLTGKKFLPTNH